MEVRAVTHPSADALRAYALGKLTSAAGQGIASHLESCPDCRRYVASLPADSFLGQLRAAQHPDATPAPAQALAGAAGTPRAADPGATPLPPELAAQTQYQIVRELGRGGMGVVYLANNRLLGRTEVLKVVNKALLSRPGAVERFLQEIRAAACLNHPNVVAAYSAMQLGECLVFAMEYVEGEDLAHLVQTRGPLPVAYACFYIQQAAQGLQHAAEQGMVHRDIKPQNLMLSRPGPRHIVKVLDFGLAKATRDKSVDHALTGVGKMLGTPDYIAPEQTVDAATVDTRADIYSLGCTLYYLLTGGPPYQADNLYAVLHAHHSLEARPINQVRADVPAELAAVVGKMMAKDPAQRYQKPIEVVQALKPFIKRGATSAPGPVAGPEGVRWETLPGATTTSLEARPGLAAEEAPPPVVATLARKLGFLAAGIAACVLLLGLVGLWAGGVLRVKTPDGILVLENLPEDAEVVVDGQQVTLKPKGGTSFEISVAAGKEHQLQVKKDGIKVFGETVEIDAGGSHTINVRREPLPPVPGAELKPVVVKGYVPANAGAALRGDWRVEATELLQVGDKPTYLFFGDTAWGDYDLELEAKRVSGPEGFKVLFRAVDSRNFHAFGLGSYGNRMHEVFRVENGDWIQTIAQVRGTVELEHWYKLRVEARGDRFTCLVDGARLFAFTDTHFPRGGVGLSTWGTTARFRNIKVTAADGKMVLWEGPPKLPAADRLQPGSVWKGTRTYRVGAYAPSTVTYELHVGERNGTQFKGLVFDNGPGRNRAQVVGEIKGETITWKEHADHIPEGEMTMQGTLQGDVIQLKFKGFYGQGRPTNEGDGELKRVTN